MIVHFVFAINENFVFWSENYKLCDKILIIIVMYLFWSWLMTRREWRLNIVIVWLFWLFLDINECMSGAHTCHASYANCINTDGSYTCQCKSGYYGDGRTCTDGNKSYFLFFIIVKRPVLSCAVSKREAQFGVSLRNNWRFRRCALLCCHARALSEFAN